MTRYDTVPMRDAYFIQITPSLLACHKLLKAESSHVHKENIINAAISHTISHNMDGVHVKLRFSYYDLRD